MEGVSGEGDASDFGAALKQLEGRTSYFSIPLEREGGQIGGPFIQVGIFNFYL